MDLIKKLKDNKEAYGLLSKEEQECFEKVGKENCDYYVGNDKWEGLFRADGIFVPGNTYRIKPDYQLESKEPQVERCEVATVNNRLYYKQDGRLYFLHEAFSDPDHIGFLDKNGYPMHIRGLLNSHDKPAPIPKCVVFARSK